MSIKINTVDITTGNYILNEIRFDDAPPIQFSELPFASADGSKFINSRYTPKTITMRGRITGTSQSNLETNIDTFKQNILKDQNITLNSDYAGAVRQWIGNVAQMAITREHFNITVAFFDITFEAADPFAYDVTSIDSFAPDWTSVYSANNFTGNQKSATFTCDGSARPLVKWTYLLDTMSGRVEQIVFKSIKTGRQLEMNAAFSAGDEIMIDEEAMNVFLNNQDYDYEGVFPEFKVGANEFQWNIYGQNSGLVVDQQQTVNDTGFKLGGLEIAQTFQAGRDGILDKIQSMILRKNTSLTSLTFKLYSTSSGAPDTLLSTIAVSVSDLPLNNNSWLDVVFGYSTLTSGMTYAFSVYDILRSILEPEVAISANNDYANGTTYYRKNGTGTWKALNSNYDLVFKTYIRKSTTFSHTSDIKLQYKKRHL